MVRKVSLVGILALLMAVALTSTAFAQADGDKFVFGENYVLRSGEVLRGNLAVLGGAATLERGSTVEGDVAVAGGQLTVAGTIEGSAAVLGGTAVLADTAVIEGDFASFGGAVTRAPGAVIQGESFTGLRPGVSPLVTPQAPSLPELPIPPLPGARPFQGFGELISWQFVTLGSALMLILLGVIAVLVAPTPMSRIASAAATRPALSFGAGLLTLIVGILAGTLLLIACCLGLVVWLALAVAVTVGWIAVGLWIGHRLFTALKVHNVSPLVEVSLGVLLITVIGRLPWCVGALFSLVVGSIGLGAVVLTRFGRQPAVAGSREPSAPPTQSLEDLDAEVLAPLALAPSTSARVEPAPPSDPSVSEIEPALEPQVESPTDPEMIPDPLSSVPPAPVDAFPSLDGVNVRPVDPEPDQPAV